METGITTAGLTEDKLLVLRALARGGGSSVELRARLARLGYDVPVATLRDRLGELAAMDCVEETPGYNSLGYPIFLITSYGARLLSALTTKAKGTAKSALTA